MATPSAALYVKSQVALGKTQVGLARMLGISRRTAQRWVAHGVPASGLAKLARLVHPRDPGLAATLATRAGRTLGELGIVQPQPPAPPALSPPPRAPPPAIVVDAVVCAAADALDTSPREVRGAVRAAFARAREIGLTVEDVEAALKPTPAPRSAP